jgi:hypothetical protein
MPATGGNRPGAPPGTGPGQIGTAVVQQRRATTGERFNFYGPNYNPQPLQQQQQRQQQQLQQQQQPRYPGVFQQQQQQLPRYPGVFQQQQQQATGPFGYTPLLAQQQQQGFPPMGGYGGAFGAGGVFGAMSQAAAMYGQSGMWQQPGDGAHQLVRFPAQPLPPQPAKVDSPCWQAANCWPEFPLDRIPGLFAFSQSGELLTVRAPRYGEDWMRYNPRQDRQRWSILNSTIAVLAASKNQPERMMLEQFESLVQPTQFLEFIHKTVPLSDANLNMVTSMHETMLRRLNALEVCVCV